MDEGDRGKDVDLERIFGEVKGRRTYANHLIDGGLYEHTLCIA